MFVVWHNKALDIRVIMRIYRSKKAYSLLEFVVGIAAAIIILLAAGTAIQLYYAFLRDPAVLTRNTLTDSINLSHIVNNIQNSAYITVVNSNEITLHSHSYPAIRKYSFTDGIITFTDGDKDPITLLTKIEAATLFEGFGDGKSNNRFNKLKIEFWRKGAPDRVLYTVASCKENWNLIYVDPDNADIEYEDGTKIFPYEVTDSALDTASEYPPFDEWLLVLSGETDFSGSVSVLSRNVIWSPDTTLSISPGTSLTMGWNTCMFIGGRVHCLGTIDDGIQIKADVTEAEGAESNDTIRPFMRIFNMHGDPDFQYNFQYTNIEGVLLSTGSTGVYDKRRGIEFLQVDTPMDVEFANNNLSKFSTAFLGLNLSALQYHHNISFENYFHALIYLECYDAIAAKIPGPTGQINYSIHDNNMSGKTASEYDTMGTQLVLLGRDSQNVHASIFNNTFNYFKTPIDWKIYPHPSDRPDTGLITASIRNNVINVNSVYQYAWVAQDPFSAGVDATLVNSNVASTFIIENNTFDGGGVGHAAIDISNTVVPNTVAGEPAFKILKNEIKNFQRVGIFFRPSGPAGGGRPQSDFLIRNNIFHNNGLSVNIVDLNFGPPRRGYNMAMENNLIYDGGDISYFFSDTGASLALTNNTLFGASVLADPANVSTLNSIIWPDGSGAGGTVSNNLINSVTYSDVSNVLSGTGNIIPPDNDPFFVDEAARNYRLRNNPPDDISPCIGAGSGGVDMGVLYTEGWENDVGVQP